MTHLLLLADTHCSAGDYPQAAGSGSAASLLNALAPLAHSADLILHAGDHTSLDFYHGLYQLGKLMSVCGNMDDPNLQHELPERMVFTCEQVKIALLHGWGPPRDLPNRVYESCRSATPDVIIFGHSHDSFQKRFNGVLVLNPGSPTRPRAGKASVGWLEIDGADCQAKIIAWS